MIHLRKKWWFSSSYVQPEDRFGTLDGFQATNAPMNAAAIAGPIWLQVSFPARARPEFAIAGWTSPLAVVPWRFCSWWSLGISSSLPHYHPPNILSHIFYHSLSSQHHLNIIIRHLVIILTPISSESQSLILGHSFPKKGWPSSCSCSFWSPAPTPPCTASVTRLRRCPSRWAAVRWCGVTRTMTRTAMPRRRRMARMTWRWRWGWEGMGKCFWVCLMMLGLGPLFLGENWEDFGKTIAIWMDQTLW